MNVPPIPVLADGWLLEKNVNNNGIVKIERTMPLILISLSTVILGSLLLVVFSTYYLIGWFLISSGGSLILSNYVDLKFHLLQNSEYLVIKTLLLCSLVLMNPCWILSLLVYPSTISMGIGLLTSSSIQRSIRQ